MRYEVSNRSPSRRERCDLVDVSLMMCTTTFACPQPVVMLVGRYIAIYITQFRTETTYQSPRGTFIFQSTCIRGNLNIPQPLRYASPKFKIAPFPAYLSPQCILHRNVLDVYSAFAGSLFAIRDMLGTPPLFPRLSSILAAFLGGITCVVFEFLLRPL
jgi:hypothetical protein